MYVYLNEIMQIRSERGRDREKEKKKNKRKFFFSVFRFFSILRFTVFVYTCVRVCAIVCLSSYNVFFSLLFSSWATYDCLTDFLTGDIIANVVNQKTMIRKKIMDPKS
jgi:hypothetical protein